MDKNLTILFVCFSVFLIILIPSEISAATAPNIPPAFTATAISSTQITLFWNTPSSDGGSPITGYKIEVKSGSGSYSTLATVTSTSYSHTGLTTGTTYTYKVSAINSVGTSSASSEVLATSMLNLKMTTLNSFTIDAGKSLSFTATVTDKSIIGLVFSLDKNPPQGTKINSNTGVFTWTPTDLQGGKSYVFDLVVNAGSSTDRQSITIIVNDVLNISEPIKEPVKEPITKSEIASFVDKSKDPQSYVDRYNNEPSYKKWFDANFPEYSSIYEAVGLTAPKPTASFVDKSKDPQSYVDRYNNEPSYKKWFDANFPEYSSIYEAVGLTAPKPTASFVDKSKDPQSYVDRYNNEPSYKKWFDANFPEYSSIYEAVGLKDPKSETPKSETPKSETPKSETPKSETPKSETPKFGICGTGTKLIDGICTVIDPPKIKPWWKFW